MTGHLILMNSLERAIMILNWALGGEEELTEEQENGRKVGGE